MGKKKTKNRPTASTNQSRSVKAKAKSKSPKVPKSKRKRRGGLRRFVFITMPAFLLIATGVAIGLGFQMPSGFTQVFDDVEDLLGLFLPKGYEFTVSLVAVSLGAIFLGATTFSQDWRRKRKGTFDVRPGDLDYYWVKKLKARVLIVLAAISFGCLATVGGSLSWTIYEGGISGQTLSINAFVAKIFPELFHVLEAAIAVGMTTMLVGQYCSLRIKSVVFAPLAAIILSLFPLTWWAYAGYLGDVPFYWTLLPIWIALLASTRTRMQVRFHDKFVTYRARRKAKMQRRTVWLFTVLVTVVACPIHRVRQIPEINYGYEEFPHFFHATLDRFSDEVQLMQIDGGEIPDSQEQRYNRCLSRLNPELFLQHYEAREETDWWWYKFEGRIQVIQKEAEDLEEIALELRKEQIEDLQGLCMLLGTYEAESVASYDFGPDSFIEAEELEAKLYSDLRQWADAPDQNPVCLVEAIQYLQELNRRNVSKLMQLCAFHGHDVLLVRAGFHTDPYNPFVSDSLLQEEKLKEEELERLNRVRWYYRLQPWERARMERALDSSYQLLCRLMQQAETHVYDDAGDIELRFTGDLPPFRSVVDPVSLEPIPDPFYWDFFLIPAYADQYFDIVDRMADNEAQRRATLIYLALRWHHLEFGELPDSLGELSKLVELSPLTDDREWAGYRFPAEIPNVPGGRIPFYYMPEDETSLIPPSVLDEEKEPYFYTPGHDPSAPYLWYDSFDVNYNGTPHSWPESHDHEAGYLGVYIDLNFVRNTPTASESPSDRELVEPDEDELLEVVEPLDDAPEEAESPLSTDGTD